VRETDIIDESYEIFRLPYELLLGLLICHYVWSNVNTQYMDFYRRGRDMDPDLMLLINFLQVKPQHPSKPCKKISFSKCRPSNITSVSEFVKKLTPYCFSSLFRSSR